MSTIRFQCPGCGAALKLPPGLAGREVRCPQCRTVHTAPVPDAEPVEDVSDAPAPPRPDRGRDERPEPRRRRREEPTPRVKRDVWPKRSRRLTLAIAAVTMLMAVGYGVCHGLVIAGVIEVRPASPTFTAELDLPPRDEAAEKRDAAEREKHRLACAATEPRLLAALRENYGGGRLEVAQLEEVEVASALAFSPDGRFFAATSADASFLWDLREGSARQLGAGGASAVAFSPDGGTLATGGNGGLVGLWDGRTGQGRKGPPAFWWRVTGLEFTPDGRALAVAIDAGKPPSLRMWDAATLAETSCPPSSGSTSALAFRPDGQVLATSTHGGVVRLWDPASGKLYRRGFRGGLSGALAFSPDGRTLAVAGGGPRGEPTLALCDLETGDVRRLDAHPNHVSGLAFSPDGKLLASGTQSEIILWDLATHNVRRRLKENGSRLAFSPGGGLLVGAELKFWRTAELLDDKFMSAFEAVSRRGTVSRRGESFHVALIPEATDADLAALKELPRVESLYLRAAGISDAGLLHLKELPALRRLSLASTEQIGDAGLAHLGGLAKLEQLTLSNLPRVTAAGTRHLAGMKQLTRLNLSGCKVGDAGLAPLAGLDRLSSLDLSDTGLRGPGLKHLAALGELSHLSMSGNAAVTAEGVEHLAGLKKLSTLDVSDTGLTDEGLGHLKGAKGLTSLDLQGTAVTDDGLAALSGLTRLAMLTLPDTVGDAGLKHLAGLPELRELEWSEAKNITGPGLAHLAKLPLTELNLTKTGVGDEGLAHLKEWQHLERLWLPPAVGDAGLKHVAKLQGVVLLGLEGTKVTDRGITEVAKMPNVQTLTIGKTAVGDAGLRALERAAGLQAVYATGSRVTEAGALAMRRARPGVTVVLRKGEE